MKSTINSIITIIGIVTIITICADKLIEVLESSEMIQENTTIKAKTEIINIK